MIIDLRTISDDSRHFDLTFEPDWWCGDVEEEQILGLDTAFKVSITIYKAGDKFVLGGRLSGKTRLKCGRCLESFPHDTASEFRLFVALPPSNAGPGEIELLEGDMSTDFLRGTEINLDDIVREQVFLSMPMKSICRKTCQGLCPVCGANLNTEKCACKITEGHPAFLKLMNLKLEGEKA